MVVPDQKKPQVIADAHPLGGTSGRTRGAIKALRASRRRRQSSSSSLVLGLRLSQVRGESADTREHVATDGEIGARHRARPGDGVRA